jgi:hypothetical protein
MLDSRGQLIRLGDRVRLGGGVEGVVVFSIDTDEFSPAFPKADWEYLGRGIMVETAQAGLIHLAEANDDVEVAEGGSG